MSADNWTVCPRCLLRARKEIETRAETLRAGYGTLSHEEYLALVHAPAPEILGSRPPRDFREDYEVSGAETGTVTIGYSGSCQTCELELNFTQEHLLLNVNDEEPS